MNKHSRKLCAILLAFALVVSTCLSAVPMNVLARVITTTTVDDFEGYTDSKKVSSTWKQDAYGDTVEVATVTGQTDSTALEYKYTIGDNGYVGASRSVSKLDVSEYKGLSFWVKQDGSGNKMVLQFKDSNGDVWEGYIDSLASGEGEVQFAFSDFQAPSWSDGNSGTAGQSPITNIGIFVNGSGTGTLYVDDLVAYGGPEVVIEDPIDDSIPLVDDGNEVIIDSFDSSVDGWTGTDVSYNKTSQALEAGLEANVTNILSKQLGESLSLGAKKYVGYKLTYPAALDGEISAKIAGVRSDKLVNPNNTTSNTSSTTKATTAATTKATTEAATKATTEATTKATTAATTKATTEEVSTNGGMYVKGSKLYTAGGQEVVMRGVNLAHVFYRDRSAADLQKISDLGANAVRLVLSSGQTAPAGWSSTKNTQSDIEPLVQFCKANGMVAVLDDQSTTGGDDIGYLNNAVNYWIEMKDFMNQYKDCVILNIANEWSGKWVGDNPNYTSAYVDAVKKLRNAGIENVIMVDAAGWGQDILGLAGVAQTILDADTTGNTMFSGHMYCYGAPDEAGVKERIDAFTNKNLCFCVGEFGWKHNPGTIPYQYIMSYAQENCAGWLAWSWYGNGAEGSYLAKGELDLVNEDNSLKSPWGTDVAEQMKGATKVDFSGSGNNGNQATTKTEATTQTKTEATTQATTENNNNNNNDNGSTSSNGGMYVNGSTLYAADGTAFLMRGININHAWYKDRTTEAIKKSGELGSNCARIVMSDGTCPKWTSSPESASSLESIIQTCRDNGQVAVVEIHDGTGFDDTKYIDTAVNYWIGVKDVLNKYKDSVIVNIANEWSGSWLSENSSFTSTYKSAIQKLRNAGIENVLMIDAPGWGQDIMGLASVASELKSADSTGNIMFSGHMYCYGAPDASGIKERMDAFVNNNLCFCVGEFGWKHNKYDNAQGKNVVTDIDYKTIMSYANEKGVNWLAWSWYGNGAEEDLAKGTLDLVDSSNSLKSPWGTDVFAEISSSAKKLSFSGSGNSGNSGNTDNSNNSGSTSSGGNMYVDGTKLRLGNGEEFVMRGINVAHAWYRDYTEQSIEATSSLGSNTTRLVISNGKRSSYGGDGAWDAGTDSASTVESLIQKCKSEGQVAIVEVHDATGFDQTDYLMDAVNYWISMKDMLNKYADCAIINIANEWYGTWDSNGWKNGNIQAIQALRNAGIKNVIMIDSAGWGQYPKSIADCGKDVLAADTTGNTMFSIHMYEYAGGDSSTVKSNIDNVINQGLCLCIGEFGGQHSNGDVDEDTIINYCQEKSVGWIAWSWKGNGSGLEYLDLSNDWSGSSLTTFGERVINGANGIKETSKKASFSSSYALSTKMETKDITNLSASASNSLSVSGNKLLDGDGNEFIMRGVNITHAWAKAYTEDSIKGAGELGSNTVRVVLSDGTAENFGGKTTKTEVENIISWSKESGQICVLELHDFTGLNDASYITTNAVNYWTEIKDILNANKDYVILNIANEWFGKWDSSTTSEEKSIWKNAYVTAIKALRNAGIENVIMVDATGYGNEVTTVVRDAKEVLAADTTGNTMFSYHMYGDFAGDVITTSEKGTATAVKTGIDQLLNTGVCFCIGEFGFWQNGGEVDERTIVDYSEEKGIGWLAWSWGGNGSGTDAVLSLTDYRTYSKDDLTDWGKWVFGTKNGIQDTSKLAYSGASYTGTKVSGDIPDSMPTPEVSNERIDTDSSTAGIDAEELTNLNWQKGYDGGKNAGIKEWQYGETLTKLDNGGFSIAGIDFTASGDSYPAMYVEFDEPVDLSNHKTIDIVARNTNQSLVQLLVGIKGGEVTFDDGSTGPGYWQFKGVDPLHESNGKNAWFEIPKNKTVHIQIPISTADMQGYNGGTAEEALSSVKYLFFRLQPGVSGDRSNPIDIISFGFDWEDGKNDMKVAEINRPKTASKWEWNDKDFNWGTPIEFSQDKEAGTVTMNYTVYNYDSENNKGTGIQAQTNPGGDSMVGEDWSLYKSVTATLKNTSNAPVHVTFLCRNGSLWTWAENSGYTDATGRTSADECIIGANETIDVRYVLNEATWRLETNGFTPAGSLKDMDIVKCVAFKVYAGEGDGEVAGTLEISNFKVHFSEDGKEDSTGTTVTTQATTKATTTATKTEATTKATEATTEKTTESATTEDYVFNKNAEFYGKKYDKATDTYSVWVYADISDVSSVPSNQIKSLSLSLSAKAAGDVIIDDVKLFSKLPDYDGVVGDDEEETTQNQSSESQKTTEKVTEDQKTTEKVTEDQKTTEKVVEGQETTEKVTEDQKTTEKVTESQKTTEKTTEDQKTTEKVTEDQKTTEKVTESQKTTEKVTEDQKTTEKTTGDQKTTEKTTGDQKTTEKTTGDQKTTEKTTGDQKTTEKTTGDQKTTEKTTGDQKTTEKTTGDQKTTEKVTEGQKTTEKVTEDQKTTEKVTEDQKTTEKVTESQKTTEKVTEDQKITEKVTESQKTTEKATTGTTTERVTTEKTTAQTTTQTTEKTTEDDTISVREVILSQATLDLEVNEEQKLIATVLPTNAENKNVIWTSSNGSIVEVDQEGNVTGKAAGQAVVSVITAEGTKKAECIVTVKEKTPEDVLVTGVSLNLPSVSLKAGESANLIATVSPTNATDKGLLWKTSDASVVTVENGKITAVGAGTATITVMTLDGGKTATCKVEVQKDEVATVPVEYILLSKEEASMVPGEQIKLSTTILPENATSKDISWTSSDESVVKVSATGEITAVAEGTAIVIATAVNGGKTAYCVVKVEKQDSTIAVTGITLNTTKLTLTKGDSQTLTVKVEPSNATNQKLIWSSTDENVATVDANGKVVALTSGVTTISVKTADGNKSACCTVEVTEKQNDVAVTGLSVSPSTITLGLKKTKTLKVTVLPSTATDKTVTYTSSNSSVATVSSNGTVKAIAPGIVTIKVKAGSITKKVTVKVKPAKVTSFKKKKLSNTKIKLSWKKQSKVTGYKVYRYNVKTGTYKLYKMTKKNYVSIANLKKNATYKFKVKAYKRSGSAVVNGDASAVYTVKMK